MNNVVIPPKDEEELQLEKLVFGDTENFENSLRKADQLFDYSSADEEEEEESYSSAESDLDGVQDDDLFYIDDGKGMETKATDSAGESDDMEVDGDSDVASSSGSDEESDDAWNDSDDEKIKVSLVASDRLKKLRKREADSYASGKSYIHRLRSQFEKIYPRPSWVDNMENELDQDSDDEMIQDEDDTNSTTTNNSNAILKVLASNNRFTRSKQLKLISPNKISIVRLKDANHSQRSKSAIQSLSFHPSFPLLMTGGFDKTLRIYHIDGKANNLVTSLHLKHSPIFTCTFSPLETLDNKNFVFAAGRRRYMSKWDLNTGEVEKISRMYGQEKFQKSMENFKVSSTGKYIGLTGSGGWCNLLNGLTGQFIRGFKIEGTIVDFEFSHDDSFIIIVNSVGEVWEFELDSDQDNNNNNNNNDDNNNNNNTNNNQNKAYTKKNHVNKVIRKWQDESGIGITKVKLGGPKDRWLAIGTNNGLVTIYDRNTFGTESNPKPIKTVENLITSISSLVFNDDGQLLCIASRAKRDALKLVHLPSGSVYSNWPTSGTPLGRVTAVTFSPNNEMLAIGNEAGKVTLWRLNHY